MKMRTEGFAEIERELDKLSKVAGKGVLRRSLQKAGEPLAENMRSLAPRNDDELVQSIAVSTKLSKRQRSQHRKMFKDDRAAVEVFVGAGALPQAHLQEFGTIFHAAQPFARPAWDSDKVPLLGRLTTITREELDKALARAMRRAKKLGKV
jgi:HK97 gp10 family phage protein